MFKPIRFNDLLKAVPGLAHLQLTPQAGHHVKASAYVRVKEQIDVDKVQREKYRVKETRVHKDIVEDVAVDIHKGQKKVVAHSITEDIEVEKVEHNNQGDTTTATLAHVHKTVVDVAEVELTPPHPPREETPLYARTHHHLVHMLDTPCAICGVRNSTLNDPRHNPFGAQAIETHHYPIERSLMNACDPRKIHVIFPQVKDHESLEEFIDSEENMMVLCDIHHRHPHYGIHHILAQDFFVQPFLYGGYQVVADITEADKVQVSNERIIQRHAQKAEAPANSKHNGSHR